MGWFNDLMVWAGVQPSATNGRTRPTMARRVKRRGAVVDQDPYSMAAQWWAVEPPMDSNEEWFIRDMDAASITSLPADELLNLLARISPEVSKAFWDFVVYVGNAVEVNVYRPGTNDTDDRAKAALDSFLELLDDQHNSFLHVTHQIIAGGFLRGAFAAELILNQDGRLPLDLATPDPALFRFRRRNDADRGKVWDLGQLDSAGEFVSFAGVATVKYVPLLPNVGGPPYGISWVEPALFPAVFLLMLLHDLRRVVANQGYTRQDVEIDLEAMQASMPPEVMSDTDQWKDWVNATIDEVTDAYASLQPDDAFVHTSVVKVNNANGAMVGGGQGNLTSAVDQLIRSIERMMVRALKTIPFLLAARQTTTETQANREWEAFTAGVSIIQMKLGKMLDRLLTLALNAQGIAADVVIEFGQLQETDRMRRAETEAIEIQNAAAKVTQGWIDNDQAAVEITGSEAVGPPPSAGSGTFNGQMSAEERRELLGEIRAATAAVERRMGDGVYGRNGYHAMEADFVD